MNTGATGRKAALDLLAVNFLPADYAVVLCWFEAENDDDTRHAFGMDIIDFWERHPDEGAQVGMLRGLYEKGPCSFCREQAVQRLIELNELSEEQRTECAYDANDDTRELVKGSVPLPAQV